jgi:hypothetical protein
MLINADQSWMVAGTKLGITQQAMHADPHVNPLMEIENPMSFRT